MSDNNQSVTVLLTEAEAGTMKTALQQYKAAAESSGEPTRYGDDFAPDRDESAAKADAATAIIEKVDAGVDAHVPPVQTAPLDPETGRTVGVGPNGEIGAGYVDPNPEPNDTNAVVPIELTAAETQTLRTALRQHEMTNERVIDSERASDEPAEPEYTQRFQEGIDRSSRIEDKVLEAEHVRSTSAEEPPARRNASFPKSASETLTAERSAAQSGGATGIEAPSRGATGVEAPFRAGEQLVNVNKPER